MNFSQISIQRLTQCHFDLRKIANEAIKESPFDFMITHGYRTPEQQFELYKKGRELIDGKWVKTGKTVTGRDGFRIKSKHNYYPSLAFDIAVLVDGKVTWEAGYYNTVAKHILEVAKRLLIEGKVSERIQWGGNFSNYDGPHFEITNQ